MKKIIIILTLFLAFLPYPQERKKTVKEDIEILVKTKSAMFDCIDRAFHDGAVYVLVSKSLLESEKQVGYKYRVDYKIEANND